MAEPRPTSIDATAAVPIDLASKVTLGARQSYRRLVWQARRDAQRVSLWMDRQHVRPEQALQLVVLGLYALGAVAEAIAARRKPNR